VLALVLATVGVLASATGGSTWRLGPLRIAVHSPWRPWLSAVVVLGIRSVFVPRPVSYSWLLDWRRFARALTAPLPFDEQQLFDAPSRSWARRLGELTLLVLVFSVLVAALTWPQVRHLDAIPDVGDPLFSIWRIDWVSHQILRNPLTLFDANIFYPERLTYTYSDSLIVPALMSAPLFWMGVRAVVAYNLLLLAGFVLSGVTTFLLVRALTGRATAGMIAGAIFALYPYRYEHYSHLELQMTMWAPLALWMLHRTMAHGRLRDGLLTGLAFALQVLSTLYTGLFLGLCMVSLGASLWLARGRPRRPLRQLAAGAVLAAVLIAPVAAAYVASKPLMGDRDYGTVAVYSAEGPDYLKPHERSLLYGGWAEGGHAERQLFPRLTPVVLSLVALWPPLSVARIAYTLSLVVAVDGSFGSHGALYPWLYAYVSPFRGLRVPARFSVLAGLILAILSGYGAARLINRWPRLRVGLTAALLAVVVVEALPRMSLTPVWAAPPDIYGSFAGKPPAVLAEFPMPGDIMSSYMDATYMYFATFHRQRLVNGNSGFFPPSYKELLTNVYDFPSDAAMNYLRARGVEYVAVHGAIYGADNYQRMLSWIGARHDLVLVAAAPWEGSESRLYRVTR
jgi:hypothetical protein